MNVRQGDEILYRKAVDQPFTLDQVATVDYVRETTDGLLVVAYLEDSYRDETTIFTDERLIARIGDPGEALEEGDAVVIESTVWSFSPTGGLRDQDELREDDDHPHRGGVGDIGKVVSLQPYGGEVNVAVYTTDGSGEGEVAFPYGGGYVFVEDAVIRVADLDDVAQRRESETRDEELAVERRWLAREFTLEIYYPVLAADVAIPDEGISGRVIHYDHEMRVVTLRDTRGNQLLRPAGNLRYRPEDVADVARSMLGTAVNRMESELIDFREGAAK